MKRLFLILTVLLISLPLWAGYDVVIDGIYYKINAEEKTAVVTNQYGGVPNYLSSFSAQYKGSIVIPETIEFKGTTLKVTSIGDYAFYRCKEITSIALPDCLLSICQYAFSDCTGLNSVTIPEGVTGIGDNAFEKCSGLTSITIPSSVTRFGISVFYGCMGELILNCDIPNCLASNNPLRYSKFTSVKMNGKFIGNYAFYQLSSIQSIELGENVTSIGYYAFYECSELTSINIPEGITSIGNNAFSNCI